MKHLQISAKKREDFGKKHSSAVRREESVPVVVYGGGEETVHASLNTTDLRNLIYSPHSYIVELDIEGKKEMCVMREVQYHPVTDAPLHIDFFRVIPGKPVVIDLPVELYGNAEGVKVGGKLALAKRKLRVTALEENLPDAIRIDVSALELGKSIFVGDLNFENITFLTPATTAVCAVKMTRAARGAQAAAAAATGKKK
ncbi:LSU ribosomal protein L25p [Mucinivorans hirudinis]|uniref:Large ribosomal subunit protein bL25 n=1 Tax=Mucinivorans hirudinis TaxID=1433126 RepID=A0A060RCI9_9BACT|nr:LSU ribosomal protein L25p [Mucinivorans hirudinis]